MARGNLAVASPNGPSVPNRPQQRERLEEEEDEDSEEEETGPRSYSAIVGISDRLTSLQDNLEAERQLRFKELSDLLSGVGERISVSEDAAHLKYKGLKSNLTEFQKQTLRMRQKRGELAERKTEEIKSLDERLEAFYEAEQTASRASEDRVKELYVAQVQQLGKEVTKETKLREGYEGTLRHYLEHDVVKLKDRLDEEITTREEMEMKIVRTATEEIENLESELKAEIKAREDTEEAMLRMMEDLVTKMEGDIAGERRDRAKKEEMLLSLLHYTCAKLQDATQSL